MSMDPYASPPPYGPPSLPPGIPMGGPTLPYADFGQRFLASLIDYVILSMMGCVVGSLFGVSMAVLMAGVDQMSEEEAFGAVMALLMSYMSVLAIAAGIYAGYYVICEAVWGQTPGKMLLGLRVVTAEGRPIGWGDALLRHLGRYINGWICYLGYLSILFTDTKQTVHDLISSTYVIRTRP